MFGCKKHGSTLVPSNQVCQPLVQTRTLYLLVSNTLWILFLHGALVLPLFMAWALAAATKQMVLAQAHACHVPYMGGHEAFDMNCETLFAGILPHVLVPCMHGNHFFSCKWVSGNYAVAFLFLPCDLALALASAWPPSSLSGIG